MVQQLSSASTDTEIIYLDSDGQTMADNTKQFEWIVAIKENLELLYADNPDVFVAGDLLWYPVEGNNKIRQAPDAMVAFGRPKGHRVFYQQWKEGDVPPQVVFEILSPGNRRAEMNRKLLFYERYGVEEYYEYDPDRVEFSGCQRKEDGLEIIDFTDSWVSPRLGVRFVLKPETLEVYKPNGERFLTFVELGRSLENTKAASEDTKVALETSDAKNKRLMARLEALGVDPDTV